MQQINLTDLGSLHQQLKPELESAFQNSLFKADFINGAAVSSFLDNLKKYLGVTNIIGCGNGTDALQLALMALELPAGAEIIVPAFNYVSAAEAVALLSYNLVFADVNPVTFNLDPASVSNKITRKTAAIIPVHLFGQCADLYTIKNMAAANNLYIIEDNAQSLGAVCVGPDSSSGFAGTIGHIGITSFFPTKMLGALGDGGALFTQNEQLGKKIKQLASHGQVQKYKYERIGLNSRLDTLQAAFLEVKLKYLDAHIKARQQIAAWYKATLHDLTEVVLPTTAVYSTHVFNQFTIQVEASQRNSLQQYLRKHSIASAIYYETPLHLQPAYRYLNHRPGDFPVAETLTKKILSLPMHPLLTLDQVSYITDKVRQFFKL